MVTRQNIEIPGAQVVHSTAEALRAAENYSRCLVIGGASVYRQFFPYLSKVHITKIELSPASDSYFPDLDGLDDWQLAQESSLAQEDGINYRFCTYIKKK